GIVNNSSVDQTLAINLTLGANQSFTAATGNLSFTGGVMTDGFTLTNDGNRTTYFMGVISGNGSFVKGGNGTTILTGNNTYTGTTIIHSGTLQVGNGGTSGTLGSGAWINNGNLVFNRSDDLMLGKSIGGTGSVTKFGSNTLTLTGNNTHSGGTIVNSGILSVAKYNALGTGDLTLNSGSLYLYSAQEMAGNVQIGRNFLWNNGTISWLWLGTSPTEEPAECSISKEWRLLTKGPTLLSPSTEPPISPQISSKQSQGLPRHYSAISKYPMEALFTRSKTLHPNQMLKLVITFKTMAVQIHQL
ncbi:MAG: hypothetical protein EBY32_17500, partial [Proteobacteria bacterium]|nr:hypothetical protein [Pseudomonadota bacterium]